MNKLVHQQKHAYTRPVGSQSEEPSIIRQSDGSFLVQGYQTYRVDEKKVFEAKLEHEIKYNAIQKFLPLLKGYNFIDIGCSSGYFGIRALLDDVAHLTFLDHDPEYLSITEKALKILHIKNCSCECAKLSEYHKRHDVGFCLALIHWIYSYSERFGSLESAIDQLSKLAKHSLFIEWVDSNDYAIELENHINKNVEIIKSEYSEKNFITSLKKFYPNIYCIGKITSTRHLFLATHLDKGLLDSLCQKNLDYTCRDYKSNCVQEQTTGEILKTANALLRSGHFKKALEKYRLARTEYPELAKHFDFNIMLAEKRLKHGAIPTSNFKMSHADSLEKPKELSEYYFNKIIESGLFDQRWYIKEYQGQYNITGNPLSHYLEYGLQNGLNPSSAFDTLYYIENNPDLANCDLHPFIHFVVQGQKEGRSPLPFLPDFDSRYPVAAPRYVPRLPPDTPPVEKAARIIAFYLPQFHPIPENDKWWGKGFTEWTNVKPAKSQFAGHYQPHIPDDFLGYYDLVKDNNTQAKQIELAKQYGIEGFCFYIYWFTGHRLLEQPLDNYLNDPTLDLPFCVCWANENWSRRWDGKDTDVLMEQHYSDEDDIDFITNAAKYLRDPRYIRINGKPLLLVYRPNLFPSMKNTAQRWRAWCRANGIGEIYLTYPQSFECVDPTIYGFDAACEFPPNNSSPPKITHTVKPLQEDFESIVYDWRVFIDRSEAYQKAGYKLFRTVTPSWDNTARKKNKGTVLHNSCPQLFEKWLTNAFIDTRQRHTNPDEQIVFINAWNEWGEGAHLEPDRRYGYAWLAALRQAHRNVLTTQMNEFKGKTLIFVDYALPMYDRFAGSRTNYMYLLVLLKMGLKVMYLPGDFKHVEPYSTELKNLGVDILAGDWFRDNWKEWFKEKGAEIDYAFLHKPDPAIQFLEVILNHTNAAIIYQCHDLHYLRLQRQAELTKDPTLLDEAEFFREKENYLFSTCDTLLTFSTAEERIINKYFSHKQVYTVPLFFYEELPAPKHDFSKRRGLLYVGGFGHTPNRDAVQWFCQQVLPLVLRRVPDIVFHVVGADPPEEITALRSANVKILGKVSEEELQALYDSVKLSVIPLRVGAGVKGKVIEALSHAVPLVSTAIGLEGIAGIEQMATPKDDPEAFAAEILALYQDENLWKKRSVLCAKFVADHFTARKTAEKIREILAAAERSAQERCSTALASLEENPLRMIAFHLPQYHPIPENDEWWGKGFTEWRNVCKAKPLFTGHYHPHIPTDLGFYDLRLEEARVAQADLAREYGIHGFCYYHYWFNGKRLLERPVEEILTSGKPDFPFCLCWANENWTRRWDGQDSFILMEQVYSEADDRGHIQDLFRFFTDPRYIRVNGKPLFLVYRTENIPDPARTAEVWREEARKAGIGELYLVRVESIGHVNPYYIGFDAALEFAPDWGRMGPVVRSYAPGDPELPEMVELPSEVYENNHTRSYAELMKQMLEKAQPPYPWLRCVTPAWDNSARRSEKAVILLGSSPTIYQQWLEKMINKTIVSNRPSERLVFVNAWNEWAEGNHLEPCIKWGRSYLEATKSGIENGLAMCPATNCLSHKTPKFSDAMIGEEGDRELASSLVKLMAEKKSPKSLLISFEEFNDSGDLTYIKGWAAVSDDVSTEGTDIMILVHKPGDKIRLIIPAKRKRPEITAYFENKCNYDFSGFEVRIKRIDPNAKITVVIKRNGEIFWQAYR